MFPVAEFLSSYRSLWWKLAYHVDLCHPNCVRIRVTPYSPFTSRRLDPSSFSINTSALHQRSCELGGQTNVGVLFSSPTCFTHPQHPVYCETQTKWKHTSLVPRLVGELGNKARSILAACLCPWTYLLRSIQTVSTDQPHRRGLLRLAPSSDFLAPLSSTG